MTSPLAQRIVVPEAGERDDRHRITRGLRRRVQDVRRFARTGDRDEDVAGAAVKLDLLGEDVLIAEVVAEAGEGERR